MDDKQLQNEIRYIILFYESRGWDWLDVVHFLLWKNGNKCCWRNI